ncbi:MAG: hypothetical protein ACLVAW_18580 [Eisenbergiella massiliensis]
MEDTGKLINRIMASVTLTGVMVCVDSTMAVIIFPACRRPNRPYLIQK